MGTVTFILWDWPSTAVEQPVGWTVLAMKRKGRRAMEFQGISEAKVGAHSEKANRWIRVPPEVPVASC